MRKIEPEEVKQTWNAVADEFNQWDSLDADEKVEYTLELATHLHSVQLKEALTSIFTELTEIKKELETK